MILNGRCIYINFNKQSEEKAAAVNFAKKVPEGVSVDDTNKNNVNSFMLAIQSHAEMLP
jgi:hypothetical protein